MAGDPVGRSPVGCPRHLGAWAVAHAGEAGGSEPGTPAARVRQVAARRGRGDGGRAVAGVPVGAGPRGTDSGPGPVGDAGQRAGAQ